MLDNITALNIEEGYKNNKTIKVALGKHAKPAKLSSGQTFKTKTSAIMDKVMVQAPSQPEVPESQVSVEPTQAVDTTNAPTVPDTTPVNEAPQVQVAPEMPSTPSPTTILDLPSDDKVLEKINALNVSYVEPTKCKDAGSRRLKISNAVVTRTANALKVMVKNNVPVQNTEVTIDNQPVTPEVSVDVANQAPEMANVPTPEEEATQEVPVSETSEVSETPEVAPESGFFLGQKLNTEEITNNEEVPAQDTQNEPTTSEETTMDEEVSQSEITQEEKDERLNQFLNGNQTNVIDISEARRALEEIANRKSEISELEKEMEEARRIRETQNQELQQLLADAPKIIADLDKDKMSRTEELSNLRAEIIQYNDLLNQKRGFQENYEDSEEVSYGRSRG